MLLKPFPVLAYKHTFAADMRDFGELPMACSMVPKCPTLQSPSKATDKLSWPQGPLVQDFPHILQRGCVWPLSESLQEKFLNFENTKYLHSNRAAAPVFKT